MKYHFRSFILIISLALVSYIISNPKPEECAVINTAIIKVAEDPSYDIVFHNADGDHIYINRGLEQELNLEELNTAVLNKSVTLHLAKILDGSVTSEHISQLAVDDNIIYSEFKIK